MSPTPRSPLARWLRSTLLTTLACTAFLVFVFWVLPCICVAMLVFLNQLFFDPDHGWTTAANLLNAGIAGTLLDAALLWLYNRLTRSATAAKPPATARRGR